MFKTTDAYLVGYYGMRNTGDDALMYATAWGVKNKLEAKTTTLGLFSEHHRHNPADKQLNLHFNQKYSGQNRLAHYKTAIKSKRIIFGGGSVLHSKSDINLKRHLMSLSSAQQSRAVGVSLGPFQSMSAEKACAKFLNECGFVGVRDNKSLAIAQAISPNANVVKTFDLAPLLLCSNRYKSIEKERKGIALALCPIAINPMGEINPQAENQRINDICQLLTTLYKNTGESITLLEFNGHSSLGDWNINTPIKDRLQSKIPLTVKPYNPDPFAVLHDIASYKALISMRLHGSVLGYLAKTPILSLNYHEKCLGWCQQIGLAKDYQFNLTEQGINEVLFPLEQGLTHGFSTPTLAITDALKMALSNWSVTYE